jgi:SAM-dependent methyltransferase
MRILSKIKRKLIETFPFLDSIQRFFYRFKPYQAKFRAHYLDKGWSDKESVSGGGSTLAATSILRERLPGILDAYNIRSIVDVPCGDFNWMKEVHLDDRSYVGLDIVAELIQADIARYQSDKIKFVCSDMLKDPIPMSDLVICRDCLVHYSYDFIFLALKNIKASKSTYLFTTTFTGIAENKEIDTIGLFRPINLQLPPFNLPPPLLIVDEGKGSGKSMGLWKISDLLSG